MNFSFTSSRVQVQVEQSTIQVSTDIYAYVSCRQELDDANADLTSFFMLLHLHHPYQFERRCNSG